MYTVIQNVLQQSTVQPDDAALALFVAAHVEEAAVSDGEDVRRQFSQPPVGVHVHVVCGVEGQHLVRVDCHQNGACVRLQNTHTHTCTQ